MIVIIDPIFPQLHSGFRFPEFNYYLEHIPEVEIYSACLNEPKGICKVTGFEKHLDKYFEQYPQYKSRIHPFNEEEIRKLKDVKLFYVLFLSNAVKQVSLFDSMQVPFIFTLYPGGGLAIDRSIYMLQRVFSSSMFKGVIVTQRNTLNYISTMIDKDLIHYQHGGPVNDLYTKEPITINKNRLNVCFVAHKYSEKGEDKGYPTFVEVAKRIHKKFDYSHFHVVGGFNSETIDLEEMEPYFTFYGTKDYSFFKSFYSNMDILLSPVNPGYNTSDAFLTGGAIEAALSGVAVFATDPHNQINTLIDQGKPMFKDKKDLVLVSTKSDEIYETMSEYIKNPRKLLELKIQGRETFYRYWNIERQMGLRVKLFKRFIV